MKINRAGLALIKEAEGLELRTYIDPVGIATCCYGHTAAAGPPIPRMGDTFTEKQCEEILISDLAKYEGYVSSYVMRPPNENQFSAMVSLCYNIGPGGFKASSVLRKFNAGDEQGAADAFRLWNKGTVKGKKVVLAGLVSRREEERALFLKPVATVIPDIPAIEPGGPVAPDLAVDVPEIAPEPETSQGSAWARLLAMLGWR